MSLSKPVLGEDEVVVSSKLPLPSTPPPPYHEEDRSQDSSVPGRRGGRYWVLATVVLCLYGFFKEFKPSEPFLTPYLTSDVKNFTTDEVNSKIYTYWPYSYLVSAFIVFLFTDLVRYKPVILVESVAYLTTRFLLIWGTSINSMRWMQVAYGVATATEIAYFSYIYAAVSGVHFKKVTSYVRAIRLFGQSMAGIVGQILYSYCNASYLTLNFISFGSVSVACVFAMLLPSVYDCVFCNTCPPSMQACKDRQTTSTNLKAWFTTEIQNRAKDFIKFYKQLNLLRWSIWWALAMCGVLQVGNYVQSLWKEVASSSGASYQYNGIVEAMATLCSAGAAFALSFLKVNWSLWGEVTIGLLSLVDSGVLLLATSTSQLWAVYICHIVYRTTYSFLITIASAQLAVQVDHHSYALIFGFNTFLALILQTILTLVVADEHGLALSTKDQFVVYSGYYFMLTLAFVFAGVYKLTSIGWWISLRSCWVRTTPATPDNNLQDAGKTRQYLPHIIQAAKDSSDSSCSEKDQLTKLEEIEFSLY